jgi:hypothetical protein
MALSPDTQAVVDALKEIFSGRASLREQQKDQQAEMLELMFPVAPPETVPQRIPAVTPTGYRFTAVVAPSKTFASGRWISIEDERLPTDAELCASIDWWARSSRFKGGLRDLPNGAYEDYTEETKAWIYDNIRLPILRAVGGELPFDWREDMQDRVKQLKAMQAAEMQRLQDEMRKLATPQPPEPEAKPAKGK